MRRDLPSGTVTFLFSDVEGSTRLLLEVGANAYGKALAKHRRILRKAFSSHGGVEVDTQGDAFLVAFPAGIGAVAAAREARDALVGGAIRVRMGLHTGAPKIIADGYVGPDVHLGARIAAAGHGGQILLSKQTRDLVDGAEVRDLGEHRLKDFAAAIPIFQLGSERFPPLRTISNTNLPRPASSFIGRMADVQQLRSLLTAGVRLLTLTGPGGSGKTRLAVQAAGEVVPEFKAGVFWVDLAALTDPALVSHAIGQTIGAKDDLADHIKERELLLVLDNFEQVIDAAPELASLVEACPNLSLLVTSRELLRIHGEVEYPVPPLAQPEAVQLFCDRAQVKANETVHELCRALDNLPLALELAAARASVLSPRQILERLSQRLDLLRGARNADPRQATLRATIDWSFALLDEEERGLFARLSVFRGGCTVEAAEEVAGATLDTLQSLVDKSLVRHAEERFLMLATVRDYAAEWLEHSGERDRMREHHSRHFLALAEEAEPHLREYSDEWLDRLERELDNFRGILDWFEDSGESEGGLRLAGALTRFWDEKGHLAEGRRRLETALGTNTPPNAARAKALNGAADMAVSLGDAPTARLRAQEGLALHRRLGDAWGAAESGFLLGLALADEAHFAKAQRHFEESAGAFRELGDEHYAVVATRMLAWMCYRLGDRERGRALHEINLRAARALRNEHLEASTLGALAMIALDEARVEDGASMLKESHRIHRDLGDPQGIARGLCRTARLLAAAGEPATAARLVSAAQLLHEELGATLRPWLAAMNRETVASVRIQLDAAAFSKAWEDGKALTIGESQALAVDSLG